jgi:hypothetical protein
VRAYIEKFGEDEGRRYFNVDDLDDLLSDELIVPDDGGFVALDEEGGDEIMLPPGLEADADGHFPIPYFTVKLRYPPDDVDSVTAYDFPELVILLNGKPHCTIRTDSVTFDRIHDDQHLALTQTLSNPAAPGDLRRLEIEAELHDDGSLTLIALDDSSLVVYQRHAIPVGTAVIQLVDAPVDEPEHQS